MVIDASALIAILLGEPEAPRMATAIAADPTRVVGAPTLAEAAAVMLGRKGPQGEIALDALLQRLDIRIVPFTADAASHARSAYRQYGKGVGSPSVLNYGDCLSYGTAMALGEPLLFKGNDFSRTDVPAAAY
ncbi:MAG TPA: type II toxin-antitoxin system VapC family toxin [Longimicrobium sp.]|nr:type II toxin-antitoxin system VapC family toxin [Longimicrobium sp.]